MRKQKSKKRDTFEREGVEGAHAQRDTSLKNNGGKNVLSKKTKSAEDRAPQESRAKFVYDQLEFIFLRRCVIAVRIRGGDGHY